MVIWRSGFEASFLNVGSWLVWVVLLALVSGIYALAVRPSCVVGVLFRLCALCTVVVVIPKSLIS
jgi:hypothetical protein